MRTSANILNEALLTWLLDSDPAIRWQVYHDLIDGGETDALRERSRVAEVGWGRDLLDLQLSDGLWTGIPEYGPTWRSTLEALMLLREFGVDSNAPQVRQAIERVHRQVDWGEEFGNSPFFAGEVEPCINGRVLALGAYFGHSNSGLLDRLLGEQLEDGGWNCAAPKSKRSSFHTTICVLEGLLAYEKAIGAIDVARSARLRGEEYLLQRNLFRSLRDGSVINNEWLRLSFPNEWHYDILWALDYFRRSGASADPRVAEAVEIVKYKQNAAGQWTLEQGHPQDVAFSMEAPRKPSRWITLRALRVLKWAVEKI